jgi:hypothetical protein
VGCLQVSLWTKDAEMLWMKNAFFMQNKNRKRYLAKKNI